MFRTSFHPKLFSFQVIIKLTDINDCHPVFSPPYNFKIREGETGSPGRVTAGDEDGTAENSEVRYSIPDEAVAKGFVVDPDTGELSVRTPLDYEEYDYKKHSVKVRATNVGKSVAILRSTTRQPRRRGVNIYE